MKNLCKYQGWDPREPLHGATSSPLRNEAEVAMVILKTHFPREMHDTFYLNLVEAMKGLGVECLPSLQRFKALWRAIPVEPLFSQKNGAVVYRDLKNVVEQMENKPGQYHRRGTPYAPIFPHQRRTQPSDGEVFRECPFVNPLTEFTYGGITFPVPSDLWVRIGEATIPIRALSLTRLASVDYLSYQQYRLSRQEDQQPELIWVFGPDVPSCQVPLHTLEFVGWLRINPSVAEPAPEFLNSTFVCRRMQRPGKPEIYNYFWSPPQVYSRPNTELPLDKIALAAWDDGAPSTGSTSEVQLHIRKEDTSEECLLDRRFMCAIGSAAVTSP